MREIKFRAWNIAGASMIDFSNCKDGIEFCAGHFQVSSGYDGNADPTYEYDTSGCYEIMQYTGLKDKNGVEIYEGDVVSGIADAVVANLHQQGPIIYHKDSFMLDSSLEGLVPLRFFSGVEVIGNIHENPELLSK